MPNKTQKIDERYQIREGAFNGLLESAIVYTDDQVDIVYADLQNYVDDEVAAIDSSTDLRLSQKADLVNGRVPSSQLPVFADTLEVFATAAEFPETGEAGIMYVDESTNKAFRWSGVDYVQIGESLVIGETIDTAYRGDRGAITYEHTLRTDNPHSVNKAQVGLSNVPNVDATSRTNHTGTQAISTVTGLQTSLDGKTDKVSTASRIYATDAGMAQTSIGYSATAATAGTIVQRGTGGVIVAGAPTETTHATTKTYVDTAVATKLSDAPSDGKQYVRKDSSWYELAQKRSLHSITSAASVTPNPAVDFGTHITALSGSITINNPVAYTSDGANYILRIKDNGTARAISWGSDYRTVSTTLPTTTVAGKLMYVGIFANAAESKMDVVVIAQEA